MMNTQTALLEATRKLETVSETARLDAEILLMSVLSVPRSALFAHPERKLSAAEAGHFTDLIERRLSHEPVAYITGEKEFWSLPLRVTAATLVPRPETEMLVERALELIPADSAIMILDLGTGTGAIAIAIASERPRCSVVATDVSEEALAVAADNAARHEIGNITFVAGDWLEPVAGMTFDVIVSNPPYIAANDPAMDLLPREPRKALVSGDDGLDAIRRIAADAKSHLVPGGWLVLEHGADQARAVAAILEREGWIDIRCDADLRGLPRVTWAARA